MTTSNPVDVLGVFVSLSAAEHCCASQVLDEHSNVFIAAARSRCALVLFQGGLDEEIEM